MPNSRKTVIDSLGYAIELEMREGRLLLSTIGIRPGVLFDRVDVEIFKAFIDLAIKLPIDGRRKEVLSNDVQVFLEASSPPFIRIRGSAGDIDIHPASWLPLSCELALCLPRLAKQAA